MIQKCKFNSVILRKISFILVFSLFQNYNPVVEIWTINKLLGWISQYLKDRGIESPRLHAELLLSHVLGLKRIELYTHHDTQVAKSDLEKLHALVKRAGLNEPVAYLVGKTEFYSIEIEVSKDCLIPRPETELLVQRAVEFLRTRDGMQSVCDLCTGSGCIAVAIAKNFPQANIIATDISDQALKIAVNVNTMSINYIWLWKILIIAKQ